MIGAEWCDVLKTTIPQWRRFVAITVMALFNLIRKG